MKTAYSTLTKVAHFIKYDLHYSLLWARPKNRNWGDDLNPWLFEKLTGKKAVYCPHRSCKRFIMAGSILTGGGDYDTCWGTGLIREDIQLPLKLGSALAVRGPLSARKLEMSGIEPPSVFGDPGLVAARLLTLPRCKKYKVSVIPHYVDRNEGEAFAREMGYNVINVDLPTEVFIREVAASEQVWSSSLHGIICSESMSIPTVWVKFSDRIVGGSFKYHDYFLGTHRSVKEPFDLSVSGADLSSARQLDTFDVHRVVQELVKVFPYKLTSQSNATLKQGLVYAQ